MLSQAYDDWVSIYNDDIKLTWKTERLEIRKLSMIYCAFENELMKLKNELSCEFNDIKTLLKRKDLMQKCRNFKGFADSEHFGELIETNKENKSPDKVAFKVQDCNKNIQDDFFIESPDTENFAEKNLNSPDFLLNKTSVSPVLNKSLSRLKRKKSESPYFKNKSTSGEKTPSNSDNSNILVESSIIAETPAPKPKKKRKKANDTKSNQTRTLTQFFLEPKKTKEIDSNLPSMDIDKMIELINKSDSNSDSDATIDLPETSQDCDKIPENLASFVRNYDRIPEKKEENPKFIYEEVVRGKARKKLKGWSCKECEGYYEALNLPPAELEKKKNACSRHRHRFKPREDTYAGFWDLTFKPTPESQNSEPSLVLNYRK